MPKYRYNNKVAILREGKILKEFTNKLTTPCCDRIMNRWVIMKFGDELNLKVGSFQLMKIG